MKTSKPFRILLYYKYIKIENHEAYAELHLRFCKALGVLGRVIVAPEGINGTVSGTVEQTEAYMNGMQMDPRFGDVVFKIDKADEHAFRRISVKPKNEIVSLKLENDLDPNELGAPHLDPKDFFKKMQEEDAVILDVRNDYEYELGHFRGAVRPDVRAFRDFPKWARRELKDFKNKPVLTYCTGGVRCEKFTGFLLREGFTDVAQLRGGIVSYGKDPEVQGKNFDGECFVFDDRLSVQVNRTEGANVISHCHYCGELSARYINCSRSTCHTLYICCENCEKEHGGACSPGCEALLKEA